MGVRGLSLHPTRAGTCRPFQPTQRPSRPHLHAATVCFFRFLGLCCLFRTGIVLGHYAYPLHGADDPERNVHLPPGEAAVSQARMGVMILMPFTCHQTIDELVDRRSM